MKETKKQKIVQTQGFKWHLSFMHVLNNEMMFVMFWYVMEMILNGILLI